MKLNLGCGLDYKRGWVNVDKNDYNKVDLVCDLDKRPYKWRNNSIDEVYTKLFIAHLKIKGTEFIEEIHRILKPKGKITIIVPHFSGRLGYGEDSYRSYGYFVFSPSFRQHSSECYVLGSFREIKRYLNFDRAWYLFMNPLIEKIANKYPFLYENTFLRSLFPASTLQIILEKK